MGELIIPVKPADRTRPAEPLPNREPYPLRSHRLRVIADLVSGQKTPASLAATIREELEKMRGNMRPDTVRFDYLQDQSHPLYNATYGYDCIGDRKEQGDQYQKGMQDEFEAFMQLPDDTPVKITEAPDMLCQQTIFGNHCKRFVGWVNTDKIAQAVFKTMVREKGMDEEITIIPEIIDIVAFSSLSTSISTKAILTTAGTIRKVFGSEPNAQISSADEFNQRIRDMEITLRRTRDFDTFLENYL